MNLFELEDQIEQMYNDAIDPETGEVNMLKIVTYDKMQERFSDIVLGLAKKTKNIEAEAEALKKFKGEIAERQKRLETLRKSSLNSNVTVKHRSPQLIWSAHMRINVQMKSKFYLPQ